MTAKHSPATPLPWKTSPRMRIAADGVTRERYDYFCDDWLPMPMHWTDSECRQFCAALSDASVQSVEIKGRAK